MFADNHLERTYAGVLGKLIGVYLGRPFEGWSYERITAELGEVRGYVHERLGVPLVVTDDDLSGTFTFLRALEDEGFPAEITPAQIGRAWLNYILPGRTVLWWGGVGNSTEHTAYLNLIDGVEAPESGSAARNGRVVSEQIGAQIFVDGWAMLAPGDPERAAELARRAASVSHDGEAVYGAMALAAMEALAFVESDVSRLLDAAVAALPPTSTLARVYADLRAWAAADGDWRRTRERVEARYGYQIYGGNCHIVPNHALILLGLLYGADDFQQAMAVVCTSGWDTDCNAGNLGCLLGIRGGLPTFEGGPDWRGPVADRLYLPTADGGRCITDAAAEALRIANAARRLAGLAPIAPKNGARFHFTFPGSLQGFKPDPAGAPLGIENVGGGPHPPAPLSRFAGEGGKERAPRGEDPPARALVLRLGEPFPPDSPGPNSPSPALRERGPGGEGLPPRIATPTFIPPGAPSTSGYELVASPTLYAGQTVRALVRADAANPIPVACALSLRVYGPDDAPFAVAGPAELLAPGAAGELAWRVPDTGGAPICDVGVELRGAPAGSTLYLDALSWDGAPELRLTRPAWGGTLWRQAWVDAVDRWSADWPEPFRIVQNRGRGLLIQGTREWSDYAVQADVTPHLVRAAGVAVRVQGLRRYYALLLRRGGGLALARVCDGEHALAEMPFPWELGDTITLRLEVRGAELRAWAAPGVLDTPLDGAPLLQARDKHRPLLGGAAALVVEEGRTASHVVVVAGVG